MSDPHPSLHRGDIFYDHQRGSSGLANLISSTAKRLTKDAGPELAADLSIGGQKRGAGGQAERKKEGDALSDGSALRSAMHRLHCICLSERRVSRLLAYTRFFRTAQTAACVRSVTAILRRMFCTCSLTVSTLMPSERPISLLERPKAM